MVALAVTLTLTGCGVGSVETTPAPDLVHVEPEFDGTLKCLGKPIPAPEPPSIATDSVDVAGDFHRYYSTYYAKFCETLTASMALDA